MLKLPRRQFENILQHAHSSAPQECCGVLLGRRAGGEAAVGSALACENSAQDPEHSYQIPPQELIRCQKLAREQSCDVLGFYHSHPAGDAGFSARDLNEAFWTGSYFLVIGLAEPAAARCFLLTAPGKVTEVRILISD